MKYPSGEIVWVQYLNRSGEVLYVVTSNKTRDWYYLYDVRDGRRIGKDRDPSELVSQHGVREAMNC